MSEPASPLSVAPPCLIVLVDDEALREALKFSLEVEGYRVEAGRMGEQLAGPKLPAEGGCLIIDGKLDGLTGLEALEQLRARGVELPAILITSYANAHLHDRAREANAKVVEKPLLGDALLGRIHEILPLLDAPT